MTENEKALFEAIEGNNLGKVKRLLEEGVDVNVKDLDRLYRSGQAYGYDIEEFIKTREGYDRTPLRLAVASNYTEIVGLLKAAGAKK